MSKHESLSQQIAEGEEFARSLKQQLKWEKAYSRIADLESALAAERKMTDTLAQALEKARAAMKFYIATAFSMSTDEAEHSNISAMQEIDAALSDWRTARGAK